jgi:DNA-binding response OmpR family regulator
MRILIVEDKRAFASHIGRALESEGHTIELAYDGDQGLLLGRTANFDLMLLDVMLPRMDGFTVIRKLREDRLQTQTILVSARDSMEDIIEGLDVLLAKVRAAGRRIPLSAPQTIQFQDLILRPHLLELQRGSRVEALTRTETALLETLMRRHNMVVPHSVLIEEGWGHQADVSFDSLYVFVRALRTKLTKPGEREWLHTVRGVGYCLRGERQ